MAQNWPLIASATAARLDLFNVFAQQSASLHPPSRQAGKRSDEGLAASRGETPHRQKYGVDLLDKTQTLQGYQEAVLAQYAYRFDREAKRLQTVEAPHIFRTLYASPQIEFWELDDEQWQKIARRPYERRPVSSESALQQLLLPAATNT